MFDVYLKQGDRRRIVVVQDWRQEFPGWEFVCAGGHYRSLNDLDIPGIDSLEDQNAREYEWDVLATNTNDV